jgi:hypothetical protein
MSRFSAQHRVYHIAIKIDGSKENATVFKKVGEHHQMGAQSMHFSPLDTGEKTFYYAHAP